MTNTRIIGQMQEGNTWQRMRTASHPEHVGRLARCRRLGWRSGLAAAAVVALLGGGLAGCGSASANDDLVLQLTPSSAQLAECMPGATLEVALRLTTEQTGSDRFEIRARNLPPERDFAIFLIQQAGAPFGAAEYIGDFHTNKKGNGQTVVKLIVAEAFASTVVDGRRVRVDLNQIGVWFADPADDDFCLGTGSPVTPFDGDNEAGVQVFNSANAEPLPAP